jgi:membrane protein
VTAFGASAVRIALSIYIGRVSGVYAAAGGVIVVLLWMYYSGVIYLFGVEVTYMYAHRFGSLCEVGDPAPTLDANKAHLKTS